MQEETASLENQIKQCREFADKRGYKVLGVYSDVLSGTKDDRPNYLKVKELVEAKAFDTLIIYEVSRISRKNTELINFSELMKENGINFISVTESSFDTTTPEGALMTSIQFGMIQFERDNTVKRTTERLYYKASEGQWLGGAPPFGYKLIDKKLVIDDTKAGIVRSIFEKYLEGYSLRQICNDFNLVWGSSRVKRILENPTYAGYIRYGSRGKHKKMILVEGTHIPIISKDIFDDTQSLLGKKSRKYTHKTNRYLLTGMLKCKECGHNYIGLSGGSYNVVGYYSCHLKKLKNTDKPIYGGQDCHTGNIKQSILEEIVLEHLEKVVNSLKEIDDVIINRKKESGTNKGSYLIEIEKLKNKKDKLLELYLEEDLSKEIYKKRSNDVDAQIKMMERKIEEEERKENSLNKNLDIENRERIISYFNKINPKKITEANAILGLIIDRIEIYKPKTRRQDDFEIEIFLNIL